MIYKHIVPTGLKNGQSNEEYLQNKSLMLNNVYREIHNYIHVLVLVRPSNTLNIKGTMNCATTNTTDLKKSEKVFWILL